MSRITRDFIMLQWESLSASQQNQHHSFANLTSLSQQATSLSRTSDPPAALHRPANEPTYVWAGVKVRCETLESKQLNTSSRLAVQVEFCHLVQLTDLDMKSTILKSDLLSALDHRACAVLHAWPKGGNNPVGVADSTKSAREN